MAKTLQKPGRPAKTRLKSKALPQVPIAPVATVFAPAGLLESYRTRWQHADWAGLIQLSLDDIRTDPDREKLAALIASVHSGFGDPEQARAFFAAAMEWGCDRRVAAQLMMSAAQNTLGRANTAIGDTALAERAFNEAIALVEPRADVALLGQMRRIRETVGMGLRDEAMRLVDKEILSVGAAPEMQARRLPMTATPLDLPEQPAQPVKGQGEHDPVPGPRGSDKPGQARQRVIVIATAPRTGSTWVYNAVRFLLEQAGIDVYATWYEHYRGVEGSSAQTHVVKVHEKNELTFPYDYLITTTRDLPERLASLIRMGWLAKEKKALQSVAERTTDAERLWHELADLIVDFDLISRRPERAILEIAHVLDVPCSVPAARQVIAQIKALQQPDRNQKHDPLTLLHPGHQSDGTETQELAAWVRSALETG